MIKAGNPLPAATYIELVRSLFRTLLPTAIMSASFIGTGLLIVWQMRDPALWILTVLGTLASAARIAVLVIHRREAEADAISWQRTRILERRFAFVYLGFALIFGAFSARVLWVAPAETHMLVVGLLFGYGAGVAAGLSLRPWISIPSILIAVVPAIAIMLLSPGKLQQATGLLLAVFLAGGVESMVSQYRLIVRKVNRNQISDTLARHDVLTGLPNRLSLRERFDHHLAAAGGDDMLVVHYLDLDRFKPVNDGFGHPVGDALLKAVSDRLSGVLRRSDFVARIGGDEFVVVQTGAKHEGEAELMARRIARIVAQPYAIDGHHISIGTSVGYASSRQCGTDLDILMACADEALCSIKGRGGGVAAYGPATPASTVMPRLSA